MGAGTLMGISAALQAFGIGVNLFGGAKAGKAAEKAAAAESAMDLRVTQEKIYQLGQEERALAGQTRARTVGSGVKADKGSPLTILAEQARSFAREKMFTSQVGAEKAQLAKTRGNMVAQQARYQSYGQALSSASSAFSLFSEASSMAGRKTGT